MGAPLVPCSHCSRHVRIGDGACPFCHTALTESDARRVVPGTTQRLTRAAAFVFGATVAACGGTVDDGKQNTGGAGGESAAGSGGDGGAGGDAGGGHALYGGPAVGVGGGDGGDGGFHAEYGAPPPPDEE